MASAKEIAAAFILAPFSWIDVSCISGILRTNLLLDQSEHECKGARSSRNGCGSMKKQPENRRPTWVT